MGPRVNLIFSLFSLPHQLSSTRRSPSSLLVLALPTGGGGSVAEVCFGRWRAYAAQAAGGVRQAVAEVERGACRGRRAACGGGGGAARAGGGVRRPAAEA